MSGTLRNIWPVLPSELKEKILTADGIRVQDVLHMAQSCRDLYQWVFDEPQQEGKFWRTHAQRLYPHLRLTAAEPRNWLKRLQAQAQCRRKAWQVLIDCSEKCYWSENVSDCEIDEMLRPLLHSFEIPDVVQALAWPLEHTEPTQELTRKYYARILLARLQHTQLRPVWVDLVRESQAVSYDPDLYLRGWINLAQWFKPDVTVDSDTIRRLVQTLAERVRNTLREAHPHHRALSGTTPIDPVSSAWTKSEVVALLRAANHVFFTEEEFRGHVEEYYLPDNSFIDDLLRTKLGIPISLCTLYMIITLGLGVRVTPTKFPRHFLIRVDHADDPEDPIFIDAFHDGKLFSLRDLERRSGPHRPFSLASITPQAPISVFARMTQNLVMISMDERMANGRQRNLRDGRTGLELLEILDGESNIQTPFALLRLYVEMGINQDEVIRKLDQVSENPESDNMMAAMGMLRQAAEKQKIEQSEERNRRVPPMTRDRFDQSVLNQGFGRLCVGLICQHKRYDYRCVIYGWDPICLASPAWIHQMGVSTLPHGSQQPFYKVMVSDGSVRYAAEENLEPMACCGGAISHPALGRYFHRNARLGYIPNEQCSREYPQDASILHQFLNRPA